MRRLLLMLTASLLLSACGGATGEPPPWEAERLRNAEPDSALAERAAAPSRPKGAT